MRDHHSVPERPLGAGAEPRQPGFEPCLAHAAAGERGRCSASHPGSARGGVDGQPSRVVAGPRRCPPPTPQHPAPSHQASAHQNSELQVERRRWPSVRSKGGHGATNPILNLRVDLFFLPGSGRDPDRSRLCTATAADRTPAPSTRYSAIRPEVLPYGITPRRRFDFERKMRPKPFSIRKQTAGVTDRRGWRHRSLRQPGGTPGPPVGRLPSQIRDSHWPQASSPILSPQARAGGATILLPNTPASQRQRRNPSLRKTWPAACSEPPSSCSPLCSPCILERALGSLPAYS